MIKVTTKKLRLTFIDYLLCARHSAKHFAYIISLVFVTVIKSGCYYQSCYADKQIEVEELKEQQCTKWDHIDSGALLSVIHYTIFQVPVGNWDLTRQICQNSASLPHCRSGSILSQWYGHVQLLANLLSFSACRSPLFPELSTPHSCKMHSWIFIDLFLEWDLRARNSTCPLSFHPNHSSNTFPPFSDWLSIFLIAIDLTYHKIHLLKRIYSSVVFCMFTRLCTIITI